MFICKNKTQTPKFRSVLFTCFKTKPKAKLFQKETKGSAFRKQKLKSSGLVGGKS
jgi:hypothetical protein